MRQAQITVGAATAVPILSGNEEGVSAILQADPTNTATVFLGGANVVASGIGLRPGQSQAIYIEGGQDLWGLSTVAGQLILVIAAPGLSHFGPFGRALVEGTGVAGTPAGGVVTVQGSAATWPNTISGSTNVNVDLVVDYATLIATAGGGQGSGAPMGILPYLSSGTGTLVRARTAAVFKPLNALAIAAETTIWDPLAKKFRLMGGSLASSVVGNVLLRDGVAGAIICVVPCGVAGVGYPVHGPNAGNGQLSAVATNKLTAQGPALSTLSGIVFGTEE